MPELETSVRDDLGERLKRYLAGLGGYGKHTFLTSGGSAAVFEVEFAGGHRAFKAFRPDLFSGGNAESEKRRLEVQRRLINCSCPTLIHTYRVEEAEGTAFVEMELITWPSLKAQLAAIPDNAVIPLLTQLVEAVRFLEDHDIVHRDIKPENIHVSPDFVSLKLLDLGVARAMKSEVDDSDDDTLGATDHGSQRPFLATAQYSSPEYLFRLDKPSQTLWKGLNFYQLGAVLHDLIAKRPIFQQEMEMGNRWLVARAVLTKTPSFADGDPNRLAHLKALASRCLVKDIQSRLSLVGWEDFVLEGAADPLVALSARVAKASISSANSATAADRCRRMKFDRAAFVKRFSDKVRFALLPACVPKLPITVKPPDLGDPQRVTFAFAVDAETEVVSKMSINWLDELYEKKCQVHVQGHIHRTSCADVMTTMATKLACEVSTDENEDESVLSVARLMAGLLGIALDLLEATSDPSALHGVDLQANSIKAGE